MWLLTCPVYPDMPVHISFNLTSFLTACDLWFAAGEMLTAAEPLLDRSIHPTVICRAYMQALDEAVKVVEGLAFTVDFDNRGELLKVIESCIATKFTRRYGSLIPVCSLTGHVHHFLNRILVPLFQFLLSSCQVLHLRVQTQYHRTAKLRNNEWKYWSLNLPSLAWKQRPVVCLMYFTGYAWKPISSSSDCLAVSRS